MKVSIGDGWMRIARAALLLALPLAVLGIVAAQIIDADGLVARDQAYAEASRNADRLGTSAADRIVAVADAAYDRVAAAQSAADPALLLQQMMFANEATAVIVRRDGVRQFPPEEGWSLPGDKAVRLRALEAATHVPRDEAVSQGWYAGDDGAVFYRCRRDDAALDICVSLDAARTSGPIRMALDAAAASLSGWSIRLRDPFDRVTWRFGPSQFAAANAFSPDGALRGWRIETAAPPLARHGILGRLALAAPIAVAWLCLVWSMVRRQQDAAAQSVARSALTAKLSHDLRTPLANLKLYTELIDRQSATADQTKIPGYCEVLVQEIDRLDTLVGNTIAYGATPPRQAIRLDDATPDDIVRGAVARLGKLLEASGCRCEVAAGAGRRVRFDRVGFERILVNLIDNARKYAPGRIHIVTELDGRRLRLCVRDYGAGFTTASRRIDGFGLGLAVVRDLAMANGGALALGDGRPGARVDVTMMTEPSCAE